MIDANVNTNYTENDIKGLLRRIKQLINNGKFTIKLGPTRNANRSFLDTYYLRTEDIKRLLLKIEYNDFCYSTSSINEKYLGNELYVFAPVYELFNCNDELERIQMYVKLDIICDKDNEEVVAISFHPAFEQTSYCFRR